MKKATVIACALSSAFLLALGLPNELFKYGFPALGFLALIPLYVAMIESPSYSFAALAAGLYGALHHALSSYWLFFFHDFAFWTLGTTTIAYGIVYAVLGLYLAYFMKKAGPFRPLAFALLWAVFEYAKSTGFLGYPWGLIPYTLSLALPMLQIVEITGLYGLSFLLAFVNASIGELLLRDGPVPSLLPSRRIINGNTKLSLPLPSPRSLAPSMLWRYPVYASFLAASVLGFGLYALAHPTPEKGRFTAVLSQQNTDAWEGRDADIAALKVNMELSRKAIKAGGKKPDLILFSESSLARPYEEFAPWYAKYPLGDPFGAFIRETGSYILTGSPIVLDWEKFEATNSVILISPTGEQLQDYAKVHPVPFAEAIPFWEYKPFREFIQNVVGLESGWVMGTEYKLFTLPVGEKSYKFGAPICFEDAFPDVCRQFVLGGADLFINLTNDSWSKTVSSETQHFACARFRAIEFRKTLIRSTNGGLSCVVNAEGRVMASMPFFTADSMELEVPVYERPSPTLYALYSDWFAKLALLLLASAFLILWGRERKTRRRGHEHHQIHRGVGEP
jgi:apolipoprotein N-acyltransferase